jgi:hypothetical protein
MLSLHGSVRAQSTVANVEQDAPQRSTAIWTLQAQSVATALKLTAETARQVSEAYITTRKAYRRELDELGPSRDDDEKRRLASNQVKVRQHEALKIALAQFLNPEQAAHATRSLGSFNPRWDRYVNTIVKLKLPEKEQTASLNLIRTYIEEYGLAREKAQAEGDRFSSVTARSLKATLDAGIVKLLSPEQATTWNEATAFRGSGGPAASRDKSNKAGGNKAGGNKAGGRKAAEKKKG